MANIVLSMSRRSCISPPPPKESEMEMNYLRLCGIPIFDELDRSLGLDDGIMGV